MPRCPTRPSAIVATLLLCLCAIPARLATAAPATTTMPPEEPLATFADAASEWGSGPEAVIENVYRQCFRTYIVSGKVLTLRVPFAQDEERSELADMQLKVAGQGKADPASLWRLIDDALASADFQSYVSSLADGREKIVTFDLSKRSWSANTDWYGIDWMRSGVYLGLPHLISVLVKGRGVTTPDIYNYLYSVGRLGLDCAGFVWWVLKAVGKAGGVDLDATFRRYLGAPTSATVPLYVGATFFDPQNRYVEAVKDEVRNLLPGDVIAFRGSKGAMVHSAVIQSVDLGKGTIRYLQSTDEAPQEQRGVHESLVSFDQAHPEVSLGDPALVWHQKNAPPFFGEADSGYRDDGERYRAHADLGGGVVVRVKVLKPVVDKLRAAKPRS
jgi:hypothetical protein